MAFVDEDQRLVGEIFEQGRRRLARLAPGQPARIVLDAGAASRRLDHLDVEIGALLQPLRFEQLAVGAEIGEAQDQLRLDALHRLLQRRARRDVVRIGVDLDAVERARGAAGQGIELGDAVDHVAEQLHPPGAVFIMRREDVDRVAAHAERAAHEIVVVAPVLQRGEIAHQVHAVDLPPCAMVTAVPE